MYLIFFYVPKSHLEIVKQAMFDAGAGRVGNYECAAWQTKGRGQFKPLAGSTPFLGTENKLKKVAEYKVEMVCEAANLSEVLMAFKNAHPYEEPGYGVIPLTL